VRRLGDHASSGVGATLSGKVDAVCRELLDALGSDDSGRGTLGHIATAVYEATGVSVRCWYVDEDSGVPVATSSADGERGLEIAPERRGSGDEIALGAWRKGVSIRSSGPNGSRFAIPLGHESRTFAVLECVVPEGAVGAEDVEGVLEIVAPALGRILERAVRYDAMRREVARFRAAVESAVYVVIAIRPDGRIEYANGAATRTFGYELGGMIDSPVTCLLAGPISNVRRRFLPALVKRAVRELGERPVEVLGRRKDGHSIPLELTITSSSVDDKWTFTAVAREISHPKRSEGIVEDTHRVGRSAPRRRGTVDRDRRTMLHAVAHEIADPLAIVRGLSAWLLEDRPNDTPISQGDRREALERLSSAAERLSKLFDAFLDLERLDSGVLAPERRPIDIGRLVVEVVDEMAAGLPDVVVDVREPVVVPVDRVHIETIVRNLLRNAATYSPVGAPVVVRVKSDPDGGLLCVQDRGPGVPRSQRRSIFEPFRRGTNASGDGLGIGLSLVSRFARAHGGRAWVDRPAEGGAAFYVLLPRPDRRTMGRRRQTEGV
jgi:PAS domain S-box-containing protein